jgi:hypothetical protein
MTDTMTLDFYCDCPGSSSDADGFCMACPGAKLNAAFEEECAAVYQWCVQNHIKYDDLTACHAHDLYLAINEQATSDLVIAKQWRKVDGEWKYQVIASHPGSGWRAVLNADDEFAVVKGWYKVEREWRCHVLVSHPGAGWREMNGNWTRIPEVACVRYYEHHTGELECTGLHANSEHPVSHEQARQWMLDDLVQAYEWVVHCDELA